MSEPENPRGSGDGVEQPTVAEIKRHRISFGVRLRNYFLAGILITAPVGLTVYIAWLFISWVDNTVLPLVPPHYNPENYLPFSIPGIGLIIVLVVLTLIGAVTAGIFGRLTRQLMESVLNRLPIIRSLYGAIKQITETVLANKSAAFRECVLVEFPRKNAWTIGFVTGATPEEVGQLVDGDPITIYVPTTPNPTSGYLIFVPRAELIYLDMSVEDGIKLVVSGGIVTPATAKKKIPAKQAVSA
ncbi:DUF502 domain-containing protein [Dongia sp.]|uniref:DUF502 domain-containing protein n=1 Tax=Dongia sp. TaxID=1977262 RepID=UPI0035B2339F